MSYIIYKNKQYFIDVAKVKTRLDNSGFLFVLNNTYSFEENNSIFTKDFKYDALVDFTIDSGYTNLYIESMEKTKRFLIIHTKNNFVKLYKITKSEMLKAFN